MSYNIPRVTRPSRDEFLSQFFRPERPVIITGALSDWPCAQAWSPEYLARNFADHPLPVEVLGDDRAGDSFYYRANCRVQDMELQRFLDVAETAGARVYMTQIPTSKLTPRLRDDIGRLDYLPARVTERKELFWMGPPSARSALHYDASHNFVAQIFGSKQWTIFPRVERRLLYLPSAELGHFSPVNVERPDLERYPLYQQAHPIEFTLNAGEVLFLPSRWPHYVRGVDFTITLNLFFRTRSLDLRLLPEVTLRALEKNARKLKKRLKQQLRAS